MSQNGGYPRKEQRNGIQNSIETVSECMQNSISKECKIQLRRIHSPIKKMFRKAQRVSMPQVTSHHIYICIYYIYTCIYYIYSTQLVWLYTVGIKKTLPLLFPFYRFLKRKRFENGTETGTVAARSIYASISSARARSLIRSFNSHIHAHLQDQTSSDVPESNQS